MEKVLAKDVIKWLDKVDGIQRPIPMEKVEAEKIKLHWFINDESWKIVDEIGTIKATKQSGTCLLFDGMIRITALKRLIDDGHTELGDLELDVEFI